MLARSYAALRKIVSEIDSDGWDQPTNLEGVGGWGETRRVGSPGDNPVALRAGCEPELAIHPSLLAVSGLVEHVLNGVHQLSRVAAGNGFDQKLTVAVAVAVSDVNARFDEIVAESLALWRAPRALESSYPMPNGDETGERLVSYLVIETIGHGWDLATTLGHQLEVDSQFARQVLTVARSFEEETLRAPGMFGPEVAVPDGATALVELVCFLGRMPGSS